MSYPSNDSERNPNQMNVPDILDIIPTEEEIEESNRLFELCGDNHNWVDEDDSSPFYKRCTQCGGAEGIKMLNGWGL